MTKTLLLGLSFIIQLTVLGQRTSGVQICVKDKKTNQPMSDAKVQVVFNDSIKLNLQLDNTGCIAKIDKAQGKYSIAVNIDGYLQSSINGVIIGEDKTAYLTYGVTAIKDLTKKEKKYFGIK